MNGERAVNSWTVKGKRKKELRKWNKEDRPMERRPECCVRNNNNNSVSRNNNGNNSDFESKETFHRIIVLLLGATAMKSASC